MLHVVRSAGVQINLDCITCFRVAGVGSALTVLHIVLVAGVQISIDCATCSPCCWS